MEDAEKKEEGEKKGKGRHVTVRNTQRRPLTFRIGGETVRLSPGEHREFPEMWLGSIELQRLHDVGHVSIQDVHRKAPVAEPPAPEAEGKRTRKPMTGSGD